MGTMFTVANARYRLSRSLPWLMFMLLLLVYVLPLKAHMFAAANPNRFNDDALQQIWPSLRYHDSALFRADYITDYYLSLFPIGYKGVFIAGSQLMDPRAFSKVVPYFLLIGVAAAAGVTAGTLHGKPAAWGAVLFCIASPIFLSRMSGGLPRSFAFPLLAVLAAALATGRPVLLAILVCVSAAFYPPVAVVGGIVLAAWLLLCPAAYRARLANWKLSRRVGVVMATAVLVLLIALPAQFAARRFGPVLRPSDAPQFPELGLSGRYVHEDRLGDVSAELARFLQAPLAGLGGTWPPLHGFVAPTAQQIALLVLCVLGGIGFWMICRSNAAAVRLLLLPIAACAAYLVSIPLIPYLFLPARYQIYPLAVSAVIFVPAGVAALGSRWGRRRHEPETGNRQLAAWVVVVLICSGCVAAFGNSIRLAGLEQFASPHPKVYRFLSRQPPDSLIAGWPSDMDDVPYLTARPVLISRETHQVFHRAYTLEMRRRMFAVIDAQFSPDPAALRYLRDEFDVRYFIYRTEGRFDYFEPFSARIEHARRALGTMPSAASEAAATAGVLIEKDWIVLDLTRLPAGDEP